METQTIIPEAPVFTETIITVTESAAGKIRELLSEEGKTESGLRVFVQGGGCSGFQYGLMIEESGGVGDQQTSQTASVCSSTREHQLPEGRRGRFRRHHHGRRVHDQEPERDVHLRLRFVVLGVERRVQAMASSAAIPDLDRLRPAGTKRSSKRDLIVNVFLKQEGHLSADDLVDLIKSEDHRISRATVYRTLQWMEEAGIARKVDFGEGRFRFEHSYRHPRHFHLICKTCNRSYEFLSSDIEALVEEVALARAFTARKAWSRFMARAKRAPPAARRRGGLHLRDAVRARCAAHRHRHRAKRHGVLRARRQAGEGSARAGGLRKLATEEVHHLKTLEGRYQELLKQDPQLESRPTFLFFKGAANGLFSSGTDQLRRDGVDDLEAYRIGIRCERGSHRFFKRYGERFEDSEGKRIFLEFAEEEREHLELLIREYRQLMKRHRTTKGHKPRVKAKARRHSA